MKITDKKLRELVHEVALQEFGQLSGKIRHPGSGKRQYTAGKIEDESYQVSSSEVESRFPGAVDAWVEVGPVIFPDIEPNLDVFDDPRDRAAAFLRSTVFFVEDGELTVAAEAMPNVKLMVWDGNISDWVDA